MLLLISILVYKNFNMDKYAMQNLHNFIFYLFIKLATCIVGFIVEPIYLLEYLERYIFQYCFVCCVIIFQKKLVDIFK